MSLSKEAMLSIGMAAASIAVTALIVRHQHEVNKEGRAAQQRNADALSRLMEVAPASLLDELKEASDNPTHPAPTMVVEARQVPVSVTEPDRQVPRVEPSTITHCEAVNAELVEELKLANDRSAPTQRGHLSVVPSWPPAGAVTAKPTVREVAKTPKVKVQDVPVPQWWADFQARITRPQVEIAGADFNLANRANWPQKGYHLCRLNGKVEGVLHVTKNHISYVEYLGHGVFTGLSTSTSRFGGEGLQMLTEKKARDFLNGR